MRLFKDNKNDSVIKSVKTCQYKSRFTLMFDLDGCRAFQGPAWSQAEGSFNWP